jgi:hypothetical protein
MNTQPHFPTVIVGSTSMIALLLFGIGNPPPTHAQTVANVSRTNQNLLISQVNGSRIRFVPPVVKNPRQSQGSGTRGCSNKPLEQNLVTLLIPSKDDIGQTISSHPTFLWHLSQPVSVPMQFALVEDKSGGQTIWQKQIDSPKPGIIQMEIPKDRPELISGKTYRWTVTLVCNSQQPSANRYFISYIQRVPLTPTLEQQLATTPLNSNSSPKTIHSENALVDRERASVYARSGLWYDAMSTLSKAAKANPKDSLVQEDLFALLDQVGLGEVANQERQRLTKK